MKGTLYISKSRDKPFFRKSTKSFCEINTERSHFTYRKENSKGDVETIQLTQDILVRPGVKGKKTIIIEVPEDKIYLLLTCPDTKSYQQWMETFLLVYRKIYIGSSQSSSNDVISQLEISGDISELNPNPSSNMNAMSPKRWETSQWNSNQVKKGDSSLTRGESYFHSTSYNPYIDPMRPNRGLDSNFSSQSTMEHSPSSSRNLTVPKKDKYASIQFKYPKMLSQRKNSTLDTTLSGSHSSNEKCQQDVDYEKNDEIKLSATFQGGSIQPVSSSNDPGMDSQLSLKDAQFQSSELSSAQKMPSSVLKNRPVRLPNSRETLARKVREKYSTLISPFNSQSFGLLGSDLTLRSKKSDKAARNLELCGSLVITRIEDEKPNHPSFLSDHETSSSVQNTLSSSVGNLNKRCYQPHKDPNYVGAPISSDSSSISSSNLISSFSQIEICDNSAIHSNEQQQPYSRLETFTLPLKCVTIHFPDKYRTFTMCDSNETIGHLKKRILSIYSTISSDQLEFLNHKKEAYSETKTWRELGTYQVFCSISLDHEKLDQISVSKSFSSWKPSTTSSSLDSISSNEETINNTSSSNISGEAKDYRLSVALEILTTEYSYVSYMQLLLDFYLNPLRAISNTPGFPSLEDINGFFPKGLELIVQLNLRLYNALEMEIRDNNIDAIGATFLKHVSFLKMYNDYSVSFNFAITSYRKALHDYPAFLAKVEELRQKTQLYLKYEDLAIMPVQRVPRYSLLLSDFIKHTPEDHPDYNNLKAALEQLLIINNAINESVRQNDNAKRLDELASKGAKLDNLISPSRFLLFEGTFKVIENRKKEIKHFFLFNDILVSIKETLLKQSVDISLPEYVWPLNLVWINQNDESIELIGPNASSVMISKKAAYLLFLKQLEQQIENWLRRDERYETLNAIPDQRYGSYGPNADDFYDGQWLNGMRHGQGKYIFNGSTYEGEWNQGKQHGWGKLKYATGDYYEGEWADGYHSGQGSLLSHNGELIYKGSWSLNQYSGDGRLIYYNGDVYEGTWKHGCLNGNGTLAAANGMVYEGCWIKNMFDGHGVLRLPSQVVFEGSFRAGVKEGSGIERYPSGGCYDGHFVHGMRQGYGKFSIPNVGFYKGEWMNNMPHGNGQLKINELQYQGAWFKGKRKGHGQCTLPDKSHYEGYWLDNVFHGQGKLVYNDGSVYNGEWNNGQREGRGIMKYCTGAHYEGNWSNNQFHKNGLYLGAENCIIKSFEGEWYFGKMHGKGHLILRNGELFKGGFKDGNLHGNGIYTFSNGATINGKWNMGYREGKASLSLVDQEKKVVSNIVGVFEKTPNSLSLSSDFELFIQPQLPVFLIYDDESTYPSFIFNDIF